ncbi:MAG: nitrous oxide reductase family maturation protein NosD [Myxococcaceae bacterium]|nr:MAG: nitrous oxide reductase family maturation protein NosD [Myxococcaceae bacterium]
MRPTAQRATVIAVVAGAIAAGGMVGPRVCGGARISPVDVPLPVARPQRCEQVTSGADLQAAVDRVPDGGALCLGDGTYFGPLRVPRAITVWGSGRAVIRSRGEGTTVRLSGRGAALLGLTVDGSGGRYDLEDAAVAVEADDVRVEGLRILRAVYGVLVSRARRVLVRGNVVVGTGEPALGLRGDGIRLWETRDSRVEGNSVSASRDVVIWYSPDNVVVGNRVAHGRYGTHLMYSSHCTVERNRYVDNMVGVFVMYTHDVLLRGNVIAESTGAAGMGLGLKDSGNITARGNTFARVTAGVYLDGSPNGDDEANTFEDNDFRLAQTAVVFHASQRNNSFLGNRFRDNRVQVAVEGGGDALGTRWESNSFDDYRGYDLDGDGVGDVPYEVRSFSSDLTSRHPALAFFASTPVLALVDAASHIAPLFSPQTILVDRRPRIRAQEGR